MIANLGQVLAIHEISSQNGFLPDKSPLQHLPDEYYQPWEELMQKLPLLIKTNGIRAAIDALPILHADRLSTEREWRRAYSVLSFLTHAYIWGGDQPSQTLPPSISRPFLNVSNHFDLPRTATYAGLNLWNFMPKYLDADLAEPENIRILHTFTGTRDEEWFYLVSVAIESQGSHIVPLMLECFEAVRSDDAVVVKALLKEIGDIIKHLGFILDRMHEGCNPEVFYHQIRPFLAGSKGMEVAGLPRGVFYDEGEGYGAWQQYSGGSNAQSSLIQMLDIMLGVEHHATGGDKSTPKELRKGRDGVGYLQEMRRYMPLSHRLFLQYIASLANIREYATQCDASPDVYTAYANATESLTTFRDKHIQIVARYIIAPSRTAQLLASKSGVNIATASSKQSALASPEGFQLSGTGGTQLMPFLKQTRDETKQAGVVS